MDTHQQPKRMTLISRRSDLTFDEFVAHWAGPHAAIAVQMPGLTSYFQNRAVQVIWTLEGDAGFQIDGIPELSFESQAAMEHAGTTEVVRQLLPADELRFLSGITLCSLETDKFWRCKNNPPADHTKVLLVAAKRPEMGDADFRHGVGSIAELCSANSNGIQVDWTRDGYGRPNLRREPIVPDLFLTVWVPTPAQAATLFADEARLRHLMRSLFCRVSVLRCDPLRVI